MNRKKENKKPVKTERKPITAETIENRKTIGTGYNGTR